MSNTYSQIHTLDEVRVLLNEEIDEHKENCRTELGDIFISSKSAVKIFWKSLIATLGVILVVTGSALAFVVKTNGDIQSLKMEQEYIKNTNERLYAAILLKLDKLLEYTEKEDK